MLRCEKCPIERPAPAEELADVFGTLKGYVDRVTASLPTESESPITENLPRL
jgi:hypothetical protein